MQFTCAELAQSMTPLSTSKPVHDGGGSPLPPMVGPKVSPLNRALSSVVPIASPLVLMYGVSGVRTQSTCSMLPFKQFGVEQATRAAVAEERLESAKERRIQIARTHSVGSDAAKAPLAAIRLADEDQLATAGACFTVATGYIALFPLSLRPRQRRRAAISWHRDSDDARCVRGVIHHDAGAGDRVGLSDSRQIVRICRIDHLVTERRRWRRDVVGVDRRGPRDGNFSRKRPMPAPRPAPAAVS